MEELKAMFRVCAHIKKDGVRCNSPAMKGMNFCYQHIGGNIRELTRARSTYIGPKLDFLYPGDRQSIQNNLFVIAQAMNDGKLDLQTACAYNRIYSACERNLRRWETLYLKNSPEKELSPVPAEAQDSADADNAGAPSFRAVSSSERVGDEKTEPDADGDNVGAPSFRAVSSRERVGDKESGEQKSASPQPCHPEAEFVAQATNVAEGPAVNTPADVPTKQKSSDWDESEIDWMKYNDRFLEIDRKYMNHPSYTDRLHAEIQKIKDEERALAIS
jgi:hypothetical protein